jgi:hypothetical protein
MTTPGVTVVLCGSYREFAAWCQEIIRYGTWQTVPNSVVAMMEMRYRRWKMKHTL